MCVSIDSGHRHHWQLTAARRYRNKWLMTTKLNRHFAFSELWQNGFFVYWKYHDHRHNNNNNIPKKIVSMRRCACICVCVCVFAQTSSELVSRVLLKKYYLLLLVLWPLLLLAASSAISTGENENVWPVDSIQSAKYAQIKIMMFDSLNDCLTEWVLRLFSVARAQSDRSRTRGTQKDDLTNVVTFNLPNCI